MNDATLVAEKLSAPGERPQRRKGVLGGVLAALLLLPAPTFGALNGLGTWVFGLNGAANPADNPFGWFTPIGSGTNGLTLDFVPKPNNTPLKVQTTVSFTAPIAFDSSSITATFSKWNDLTMTKGSVTIQVQAYSLTNGSNADINNNPNMFTGAVPANLNGATTLGLVVGNHQVVNVIFTFAAGSTWTTTTSSAHTVFQ